MQTENGTEQSEKLRANGKGTEQSEKVTEQSETAARAIGKRHRAIGKVESRRIRLLSKRKRHRAIGKVKSKRKRLSEQSEKALSNRKMALSNQKRLPMQSGTTG